MNDSAAIFSSMTDVVGGGHAYAGPGILTNPQAILRLVQQDHGLPEHKKRSLSDILNSPEAFDHVMVGVTGMLIAQAAGHYANISKPARTLLSLAGFGIGNILYNTLHERKFTDYDKSTGIAKIRM